jgi:hypothetical protein
MYIWRGKNLYIPTSGLERLKTDTHEIKKLRRVPNCTLDLLVFSIYHGYLLDIYIWDIYGQAYKILYS